MVNQYDQNCHFTTESLKVKLGRFIGILKHEYSGEKKKTPKKVLRFNYEYV